MMKIRKQVIFIIGIISLTTWGCVTTPTIGYFDSSDTTKFQSITKIFPESSIISSEDILAVTLSSMNKESNEILNFNNITTLNTTSYPGITGGQRGQPLGFLVDKRGDIEIPFVGKVKVEGLTLEESADKIKKLLEQVILEPSVNVRFLNFKYSVLGEVTKPGVFNLLNDKTTLPEALAIAGDLTLYGNRRNVMLIRDENKTREIVRLDLTTKEVFLSPRFYIKNGDVIYVEPLKSKGTFTEQKIQLAPLYMSGISTALTIITLMISILK
jgi:polysaccharide biosynthesis/export protein